MSGRENPSLRRAVAVVVLVLCGTVPSACGGDRADAGIHRCVLYMVNTRVRVRVLDAKTAAPVASAEIFVSPRDGEASEQRWRDEVRAARREADADRAPRHGYATTNVKGEAELVMMTTFCQCESGDERKPPEVHAFHGSGEIFVGAPGYVGKVVPGATGEWSRNAHARVSEYTVLLSPDS